MRKRVISRKKSSIITKDLIDRDKLIKDLCKTCYCHYGTKCENPEDCLLLKEIKKQKSYSYYYIPADAYPNDIEETFYRDKRDKLFQNTSDPII